MKRRSICLLLQQYNYVECDEYVNSRNKKHQLNRINERERKEEKRAKRKQDVVALLKQQKLTIHDSSPIATNENKKHAVTKQKYEFLNFNISSGKRR